MREKKREDLLRELTGWLMIRLIWADLFRPLRRQVHAGSRSSSTEAEQADSLPDVARPELATERTKYWSRS